MSSRQRVWARRAYNEVCLLKNHQSEEKFRTLCMEAPELIHRSGLAQALVFLWSRKDNDREEGTIGKRFLKTIARIHTAEHTAEVLVTKALEEKDLRTYMILTSEISDIVAWMRRFAQIELKSKDTKE